MTKAALRKLHKVVAPIVFLPLLITIITGISYRLAIAWFGVPKEQVYILVKIHEGAVLGDFIRPFYVLLNGIGLLWMLITGLIISGILDRKPKKKNESKSA